MTRGGGEDRRTLPGYDPPTNERATASENADGFTAAAIAVGIQKCSNIKSNFVEEME